MSQNKQQDESVQKQKEKGQVKETDKGKTNEQSSLPLFLRGTSEGSRGDAQDEKDEMEE